MTYFRPTDLTDALDWLGTNDARIVAGCTDLFPATETTALHGPVLDVTGIAAMRGISETETHWRLGATTTWSDIVDAELPPAFDALKQAGREIGSLQIQNAATIGGNLCNASPAADGVPCLLNLDASVELASKSGVRDLQLNEFILGPRRLALASGEILNAILVPKPASGRSAFVKLGARRYLVISIAMAAVRMVETRGLVSEARVAVGACSPVAMRLPAVEAALLGRPMDGDLAAVITDDMVVGSLSPITDARADHVYRNHAAVELVRRAVRAVLQ